MAIISVSVWQTILRFWFLKLHSLNQQIILLHRLMGLFEYLFMFWLKRHLPAKQALNSKLSAKGYERIMPEILRRCGYFSSFSIYPSEHSTTFI